MRLFGALITPTTLSLPCRRRKTAVVRSTTARCRCRRSGRRRGRQTCPCARRRGRRRHGGHAAPCAQLPLLDRRELSAPASAPPCTSAGSARLPSRPQSQSPPSSMLSPARSTPTSAPSAGNTRPLDSHSPTKGGLEAAEATEIIDCTVLGLAIVDAQGPRTGAAALPRSARPQACTSAPKWLAIVAANAS